MELTQSEFETKYNWYILRHADNNGVSFNSSLDVLHEEYKKCDTESDWTEWLDYIKNEESE